jgi:adenylate cyclase
LAYQAIDMDPQYSGPYGLAASGYILRKANRWTDDPAKDRAEVARLAAQAAEVGRDDAFTLSLSGFAIAEVLGDLDAGVALIDRALALTPNFAAVLTHRGVVSAWLGEPDRAIDFLQRAMRLSPVDPITFVMQAATGLAHFIAGRDNDAFSWSEKTLQRNPFFLPALRIAAASAAFLGRMEDAGKYLAHQRQLDPGSRVSTLAERVNLRRPQDVARLAEGLRKAGLAE